MSWARGYGRDSTDPRLYTLTRALGISLLEARGLFAGLRDYAVLFRPDGYVADVDADELAGWLAYEGDADALVAALVRARLIIQGRVDGEEWERRADGWRDAARKREERRVRAASGTVQDAARTEYGRSEDCPPERERERGSERENPSDGRSAPPAASPATDEAPLPGGSAVRLPAADGEAELDARALTVAFPMLEVPSRLTSLARWLARQPAHRRPTMADMTEWVRGRLTEDAEDARQRGRKLRVVRPAAPPPRPPAPTPTPPKPADSPGELFATASAALRVAMDLPPGERARAVHAILAAKGASG